MPLMECQADHIWLGFCWGHTQHQCAPGKPKERKGDENEMRTTLLLQSLLLAISKSGPIGVLCFSSSLLFFFFFSFPFSFFFFWIDSSTVSLFSRKPPWLFVGQSFSHTPTKWLKCSPSNGEDVPALAGTSASMHSLPTARWHRTQKSAPHVAFVVKLVPLVNFSASTYRF